MEALLDTRLVHHMLLYECHVPDGRNAADLFDPLLGTENGGVCNPDVLSEAFYNCIGNSIFAWAVGSRGEILPEHVGIPIGKANNGGSYFVLETHYDNLHLKSDVTDNSGMRFYLTDELREFNAGESSHKYSGPRLIWPPRARPKVATITGCLYYPEFLFSILTGWIYYPWIY